MKKAFPLLATLLLCWTANAQQTTAAVAPATMYSVTPKYVYCEIIAEHIPSYTGDGVIFDFGQKTEAWSYNWLQDAEGNNLLFESGVEALNYMIFRGWEFVQAYTSGEDAQKLHYLLRLPVSKLSPEQLQLLLTAPRSKRSKKIK